MKIVPRQDLKNQGYDIEVGSVSDSRDGSIQKIKTVFYHLPACLNCLNIEHAVIEEIILHMSTYNSSDMTKLLSAPTI